MLSRVADALFWMSRYLERAELIARLLDVSSSLDLDLQGVVSHTHEMHWQAVAMVMQAPVAVGTSGMPMAETICEAYTFDLTNPGSIAYCVNRSRNNARSIRGTISSDMWRELNKLYWQLWDADFRARVKDSPHDLYQTVELGSHVFQGVCDSTMPHDEGWQFIQLGKAIEKAEKTLRLLEARYDQLHGLHDPTELPVINLHWGAVLKCCLAFQPYQRLYISRVEPDRVIEFLLFNPEFPHSVHFCLREAFNSLDVIGEGRARSKAARILGHAVSELEYADRDALRNGDWRPLLSATLQRCLKASAAIHEQYS